MLTSEIANLCVVCHKSLAKIMMPTGWQHSAICKSCGLLYVSEDPGIPPEDPRYESYVGRKIR